MRRSLSPTRPPRPPADSKFDEIHERLAGLEKAVNRLNSQQNNGPSSIKSPALGSPASQQGTSSGSSVAKKATHAQHSDVVHTPYTGPSSFMGQAMHASEVAHLEEGDTARDITAAPVGCDGYYFEEATQGELDLPPSTLVLSLLRHFQDRPSPILFACGLRNITRLEQLCSQAYFPTEPLTPGEQAILFGTLHFLLVECLISPELEELRKQFDWNHYSSMCARNFQAVIQSYDIIAVPAHNHVHALYIAMMQAQDAMKPRLAWMVTSAAARQLISLGYHRKSSLKNCSEDEAYERAHIFWMIYSADKNLALTLGRTPTIQDYDIDQVPISVSETDLTIALWDRTDLVHVDLSRLQGQVYEKLYSLAGLNRPAAERSASIVQLQSEFEEWHRSWDEVVALSKNPSVITTHASLHALLYGGIDATYYALLTTLHRASSFQTHPTQLSVPPACYDAAVKSLLCYLRYLDELQQHEADFPIVILIIGTVLLYTSYTPLVVIFLHALASGDRGIEDVEMLERMQSAIGCVTTPGTEAARVLAVCKNFAQVARQRVTKTIPPPNTNKDETDPRGSCVPHRPSQAPDAKDESARSSNTSTPQLNEHENGSMTPYASASGQTTFPIPRANTQSSQGAYRQFSNSSTRSTGSTSTAVNTPTSAHQGQQPPQSSHNPNSSAPQMAPPNPSLHPNPQPYFPIFTPSPNDPTNPNPLTFPNDLTNAPGGVGAGGFGNVDMSTFFTNWLEGEQPAAAPQFFDLQMDWGLDGQ